MSRRWLIFAISTSLFFLSQFYRVSNAVIAPLLIQDLALDTKGLGLISASFFYAFAIAQIPISIFLDKVGSRRMMTALSAMGTPRRCGRANRRRSVFRGIPPLQTGWPSCRPGQANRPGWNRQFLVPDSGDRVLTGTAATVIV